MLLPEARASAVSLSALFKRSINSEIKSLI
jgi:hypothetical protein